ncbi:carbohydrate binding domain-containing protein [Geomonas propionica]|uniref:Carbohydrate binding domain-containing protein n=1 Tax=Geomonas propionica TaxID=2798582 RepID=A0ABS0YSY1_9BACT|nr:carbohydrate binding domain-containing protein [Geomonas propionica]MBJ6801036.1 carbohydrate binding domain-containing protein [Geomonas propionica]
MRTITRTSSTVAIALIAASFFTGCKKEETAKEPAPAQPPAQQVAAPAPSQATGSYDFESGAAGWIPSTKGVTVATSTEQKHNGQESLKVSGTSADVWNFASSPKFDIEAGKKYKISCWMYIDSWDKAAFPPLVKYGVYQDNKFASNAFTAKYDMTKVKQWQQIGTIFTAPKDGKINGYLSIEKGTKDPITATIYLDDVKVVAAQ